MRRSGRRNALGRTKKLAKGPCAVSDVTSRNLSDDQWWCGTRPWRSALDHGVDEDEQLSGASDEDEFVRLARSGQTFVERNQLWVPIESRSQGRVIKTAA